MRSVPNEIYFVKQAQSFQYGLNNIRWIVFNEIKSALFAPKSEMPLFFFDFTFCWCILCWSSSIKSLCAPLVHLEYELKHYFYRINKFFQYQFTSSHSFLFTMFLSFICAYIYIKCTWFLSHLIEKLLFTKQLSEKKKYPLKHLHIYAYISLSLLSRCMSQN